VKDLWEATERGGGPLVLDLATPAMAKIETPLSEMIDEFTDFNT